MPTTLVVNVKNFGSNANHGLAALPVSNSLALLHDPKDASSFSQVAGRLAHTKTWFLKVLVRPIANWTDGFKEVS